VLSRAGIGFHVRNGGVIFSRFGPDLRPDGVTYHVSFTTEEEDSRYQVPRNASGLHGCDNREHSDRNEDAGGTMSVINVHRQGSIRRRSAGMLLLFLLLCNVCMAREKKDVIQLTNGDRLTCEIIELKKGYLYVKLDYVDGTVALDWSKIAKIESAQEFVVADKAGRRYTGSLENVAEFEGTKELRMQVAGSSTREIVSGKEVVEIDRTDNTFWQNLHGGLSTGLNFSKAQSRTQYNFQANTLFQRTKWSTSANYQSSFSGGGDISDLRNDLSLNITRQLRSPRNFYLGLAEFLQSDQQQLDLRTTIGGAVGHVFRSTNNSFVAGYSGVVWNREHYSPEATVGQTGESAELVFGTQLNFFRFKTTNILATANLYPSMTEPGRVRFDLNTSLKLRIAKDLYWNFGYYLNVDSRPPRNLAKTDYGSTSSLGWTF